MKILFITIILFSSFSLLNAQVSDENFKKLEGTVGLLIKHKDSINEALSKTNLEKVELETRLINLYKSSFKDLERSIRHSFDKTDVISNSATYQQSITTIIKLHNDITKIHNFTDAEKVFGFDFVKQINSIAEKNLINTIVKIDAFESDEILKSRKENFKNIVKNIVDNPIISGLLKSNPITSVAHSIINQTMSAQSTQIKDVKVAFGGDFEMPDKYKDFKKNYDHFKNSYTSINLVGFPQSQRFILNKSIDNFTNELNPLINLFDELSGINDKYEGSLKILILANEETINRAKPIEDKFYEKLNATNRLEASTKINTFFNVGPNPSLAILEQKLNDPDMAEALKFTSEIEEVHVLLKNDFIKILSLEIGLADAYIAFFEGLKSGKAGMPTFTDVSVITKQINQFKILRKNLSDQKTKLEGFTHS